MKSAPARPQPTDDSISGFDELMGAGIPAPITALYESSGSTVDSIVRIQATWRPERSLTVRFRVYGSGGGLGGRNDVVAVVGNLPDGTLRVEGPDATVALWIVPDDPQLPGLRSALDTQTVSRLLSEMGSTEQVAGCHLRAYRPGRRAVVEVAAGASSVFLKVVRPSQVDDLHERHRHLAPFLPVPDSLGLARALGVVVMPSLPGTDLRSILRNGSSLVPDAADVAGLVSGLPMPRAEWRAGSPAASVPGVVSLLQRLLPEEEHRLNRLADSIDSVEEGPEAPVHGDFHEAQILVDSGRPVGLIDVDTFGWGQPIDDAATMLGHLHLLAPGCRAPHRVTELARKLNRIWDEAHDPVQLRLRTAAVVLGLATGPFRVQSPSWPSQTRDRIAVAERWVESARRVDEKSLIAVSGSSHERSE